MQCETSSVRWADYTAHTDNIKIHTKFWSKYLKEKDHLGDQGTIGKDNIKMHLKGNIA
jgi:hypothetical protein